MEILEYKTKDNFRLRLEARLKNGDLVRAREGLGLTAKDAARLMGISYCNLINFENLKAYPNKESQKKIFVFYERNGISISK
jgi:DNA-binding transcriptional regulator YiaG